MYKKNNTISIKIGILLLLGFTAIFSGGYYTYNNLLHAINILSAPEVPNSELRTIKNLTVALEQAENNVRLYGITNQKEHLNKYILFLTQIDSLTDALSKEHSHNLRYKHTVDNIKILVNQKTKLWEEMIIIWKEGTKPADISGISSNLKEIESSSPKFISRFFGLRKDKRKNSQQIIEQLDKLEKGEKDFENKLFAKENQLAQSSEKLNLLFNSFINRQKKYEQELNNLRIKNARALSEQSYRLITWFTVIGIAVVIVLLIVIVQYIRKNHAYNLILEKSRLETEKLARAKEQFMANVSHEIRTPLNAISGFVKQLISSNAQEDIKEKLSIVNEASDQLIHLINGVLDLSKLQSGNLPLHEVHFSPADVICNVCLLFNELAVKNGNVIYQHVENPYNFVLFGDENKFQQILYNLISNANKFTEDGVIHVNAGIARHEDSNIELTLEISDTGLGIEQSKLNDIFNEYTQANNEISVQYGGTGLGLSIVKNLVLLFNGTIDIQSRNGEGTRVKSVLLFQEGNISSVKKKSDEQFSVHFPENTRVLVADDEEYNSMLMNLTLRKWNLQHDIAKNGYEAIELLKEHRYNYVLMDLRMPVINGFMVTKFIRETLKLPKDKVCVIGVTADILADEVKELKEYFNDILIKPFTDKALYTAMSNGHLSHTSVQHAITNEQKNAELQGNLSNLLHVAGNDISFVQEMIQQFEQSTLVGLKDIKLEIENESYEKTADLAHKLAPACRHLEANNLLQQLKQIEEYARVKNKANILKLLPNLYTQTQQVTKNLYQQLKEYNN